MSKIVSVEAADEVAILDFFKKEFEGEKKSPIEKERPKELDDLIPIINVFLREFLSRYGVDSIDIPAKNIHIIDQSKLTPNQLQVLRQKYENVKGIYLPERQHIFVFRDYSEGRKLAFLQTLVHEMLHLNSFLSFQKLREGEEAEGGYKLVGKLETGEEKTVSLGLRRLGFRLWSRSGDVYFYDLDEAIISELVMRFDWRYFFQLPQLAKECQRRQEALERISHSSGKSIDELRGKIANVREERLENGSLTVTLEEYSWKKERDELYKLVDDLFEKNKSRFSSREEVFDVFARAVMTGRLLPVARLIEKTFGKGSFREIGERMKARE